MAQVLLPPPRRDALDRLAQALGIAQSIFGIKHSLDQRRLEEEKLKIARAQLPVQQAVQAEEAKKRQLQIEKLESEKAERDRIKVEGKDPKETTAKDIMTKEICVYDDSDDAKEAYKCMTKKDIVSVPIVKDKKYIGTLAFNEALKFVTNPDNH